MREKIRLQPVFVLGEEPEFLTGVGTKETIKDPSLQNQKIAEIVNRLRQEVGDLAYVHAEVVIRTDADIQSLMVDADILLIYRLTTNLLESLLKIAQLKIPIIFFAKEGSMWHTLEAPEYLPNVSQIMVCHDYKDVEDKIRACYTKNKLKGSKILAFVPDILQYQKFLEARYRPSSIKDWLGFDVEIIGKEEMLEKFHKMSGTEIGEKWISEAEKVVEPSFEDVENVAKLYLTLKAFCSERRANAVAISCNPRMEPMHVPCLAISKLRGEGLPAACEVDLYSAVTMTLLYSVSGKPAFMGNVVNVDATTNTIAISHCAMPFVMDGSTQQPYTLRSYHDMRFRGSVTAYVKLKRGQKVTIARMGKGLREMLIMGGEIVDQKDGYDCRNTVFVKVSDVSAFFRNILGNHHCLIYGDYVEPLLTLCQLLGVRAIEI